MFYLGPLASKANKLTLLTEKSPRTKLGVYKLKILCYNISMRVDNNSHVVYVKF